MASASAAPWACGRIRSWSPWITSTGQRTRATVSSKDSSRHSESADIVSASVSGSVSSAQRTQSSICLVECGSLNIWAKKNSRKPR